MEKKSNPQWERLAKEYEKLTTKSPKTPDILKVFLDGTLAPEDAVYFTDEDQQKTINSLFDSADSYLKKLSLVEFAVINQAIAFYRRCGDKLLKIKKTTADI